MFEKIVNLFSQYDCSEEINEVKEFENKMDCCILGYHKWVYVVDKKGNKCYRICDVCGKTEKIVDSKYFLTESDFVVKELKGREKKALFNCIIYDRKKKVYRLKCPCCD